MKQIDRIIKYKALFNSPDGKEVLDDLFNNCFMIRPTLTKSNDSHEMAYHEGQRSVVLRILHYLETDIEAIRDRMARIHKQSQQDDEGVI